MTVDTAWPRPMRRRARNEPRDAGPADLDAPSSRRWPALAVVFALFTTMTATSTSTARADSTTTPYPGVTHRVHDGDGQRWHLVTIDLARPSLRLHVSSEANRGKTVSSIAQAEGAVLAVNGQIFHADFSLCGIAMARGVLWAKEDDASCRYAMGWGAEAKSWTSFLGAGLGKGPFPTGVTEITGGYPWLVKGGVSCDGSQAEVCTIPSGASASFRGPNPRTFLGVDEKRTKAFLVVVDGREVGNAAGMTLVEGATLMATTIGAFDAVNLDGGGSSTLFIANEGGVVNAPSDGSERVVADAIVLEVTALDGPPSAPTAATPTPPRSRTACGCRVGAQDSGGAAGVVCLTMTFALARRRRRS